MSDTLVFTLSLINTGGVIFLLVYFVITLSDLECDYLNAQQCCSRLNYWLLPKLVAHFFPMVLLLGYWHIWLLLVNIPLSVWLVYEYLTVPTGNIGVYDPTEIHNRGELKKHMRNCMIHLGYYFTLFFVYMYCLIVTLLKGNAAERAQMDFPEF